MVIENMTEEVFASALQLVQVVGSTISVSKKGYVKLIRELIRDLQAVPQGNVAMTKKLADHVAKFGEWKLWVQLSVEAACRTRDLQERPEAKVRETESAKRASEFRNSSVKEKGHQTRRLKLELPAALSAIG